MKNSFRTKQELIEELLILKKKNKELEKLEASLKRIEEALHPSELTYQTIFETTGTSMLISEEDMTISLANEGFVNLTGYTRKELEGKIKWTEFVEKSDLEKLISQHQLRMANSSLAMKSYEFRLVHRYGCLKHILLTVDLIPGTKKSVAALIDITDHKQAEDALLESEKKYRELYRKKMETALKESEERFKTLFEASLDIVCIHNLEGKSLDMNQGGLSKLGYDRKEIMSLNFASVMDEEQRPKAIKIVCELLQTGVQQKPVEFKLKCRDGSYLDVETKSSVIHLDGKPYAIAVIARDITERKKKEEELKKLVSELQKAIEEIKTLKGIVPICANCKKIRDDEGYWEQVESYISKHTATEFTHGICPECMKELYPEFCKDKKTA